MYFITVYQPIEKLIDIQNWLDDNTEQWNWYVNIADKKILETQSQRRRRFSLMVTTPKLYGFQVGVIDEETAMAYKLRWL